MPDSNNKGFVVSDTYITPYGKWEFGTKPFTSLLLFDFAGNAEDALKSAYQGYAISVKKTKKGCRVYFYHNGKRITKKEAKIAGITVSRDKGKCGLQVKAKTSTEE